MTAPRFDAVAARLLERARSGGVDPPLPEERQRAILLVEQAIRRKNRRRFATRFALAAAAVAVLGVGLGRLALHRELPLAARPAAPHLPSAVTVVGHPTGGGATVVETGTPAPLTDGRSLAPGSRILARADGHVVLSVSTGTRLTVEEGGDVSIVDSGPNEVFAVRAGAVRAEVAKLHAGQRFIIRSPDAEVEVRGTSFRVAVAEADPACEGGTVTRVSVFEGVVSVRHAGQEARIAAGESWPNGCVAKREATGVHAVKGHVAARAVEPTTEDSAGVEQTSSDLREQNDCMARAFAAKRRGAAREAIEGFETFAARYPTSSLVENALVQRMQLLRTVDPQRAAKAAEQYLARYPKGFARSEAQAILRQGL
jgi:hypothetical protein